MMKNNNAENRLFVWYQQQLVGQLIRDPLGRIGFTYDDTWLKNGFPISHQCPLSQQHYLPEENTAHQFFANLLPEAHARIHIVRTAKIPDTDFDLLKALGADCAGALSILPINQKPEMTYAYEEIDAETLKKIILYKGFYPTVDTDHPFPRLSLAGVQEKCPILVKDKQYYLPQGSAPSSHILKFEVTNCRNVPLYECFMTHLAQLINLPVCANQIAKIDKQTYLLVKRYDRLNDSKNQITRLHQEDFCQALGLSHHHKYQKDGGPSLADCFRLIQDVSVDPFEDIENLLKWQVFNVLAGNSDGHAKNLSLLYGHKNQPKLAPFYDLVCTRAIKDIDRNLAMSVGNEFDPSKIELKHWQQLAEDCKIRTSYLIEKIQEISTTLTTQFGRIRKTFEEHYGEHPALQRIEKVILKQCKIILRNIKYE